jgi:hypothetical protein
MTRKEQSKFCKEIVEKIAAVLEKEGVVEEVFYTNDFQTITFEVGGLEEARYGSLKFTLHKVGWDLDDAIEEYEEKLEKESKA